MSDDLTKPRDEWFKGPSIEDMWIGNFAGVLVRKDIWEEQQAEIERLRERLRKYEPEHGVCEHGVPDGEWCAACNRLTKAAREEE